MNPSLESSTLDLPDRIVVTGAKGQLGTELCRLLGPRARPLDLDDMDITDPAQIRRTLPQLQPHVVINTAAYTAVDAAEEHPEVCYQVNQRAVATLAQVTRDLGCRLVQISTDYVFTDAPQRSPFAEDAAMAPRGVYAESKAQSEREAAQNPQHLIVRTCGIYGPECANKMRNFVSTMVELGRSRDAIDVVNDQVCCPTYVAELAPAVLHLIRQQAVGIYHVVNRDGITWFDFAREIMRLTNSECRVNPISTQAFGAAAWRPPYSVLDTSKYDALGGPPLSTCREAVAAFLQSNDKPPSLET